MSNPNDSTAVAQAIYQATMKELSSAHDETLQREVLKQLDQMLRTGEQNIAHLSSAIELTADEKRTLENKLRAKFGRELAFEYKVDPSLLGGVVAKVGDKIIDGSLASKLNALQEALLGAR